jgi:N-acetylglucosaminyldiphosphoundecaprenol N-acetyl-beta-D-mannosaminyltransferase
MSETVELFGLPFFAGSKESCRQAIKGLALAGKGQSVVFANAHVVVESNLDSNFKKTLNGTSLIVPDGTPIAWVLHHLNYKEAERYSGPDLMEDLFEETKDKKHFFLGSSEQVLHKIKEKFNGQAAGFYSPPFSLEFSDEELQKQINLVDASGADYIWVGLGAPKQEKYVVKQAMRAKGGVWCAVGAAFDFYSETKPRAPVRLQSLGLEWAYRMFTEPRRLAIRYLKTNPLFIKLALVEMAKPKKGKGHS